MSVISYPGNQFLDYDELLSFVIKKIARNSPFVVLGESFSGPLAIRLAAQSPTGLCGLILVATFVNKPVRWLPVWIGRHVPVFPFRLTPAWWQLRSLSSGKSTRELRQLFSTAIRQVRPQVLAHRVREVFGVNVVNELQRISVPILALAGRHDRTVPAQNLRQMQRLRSDLRVEMIDGDHLLLQTEPEWAAVKIASFLATVGET